MNIYAGEFLAPARPGHRGYTGGGTPPPPTVPYVQHARFMAGSEQDSLVHRTMKEGGVAKDMAPVSGGGEVGHFQGIHRVCTPPGDGDLF